MWKGDSADPESYLQRFLPERRQEASSGRLPYRDRPAGGVPPPLQHAVQPAARVVSDMVPSQQPVGVLSYVRLYHDYIFNIWLFRLMRIVSGFIFPS